MSSAHSISDSLPAASSVHYDSKLSLQNKYDIISTIVTPILFLISFSLVLVYAIKPIPPMVPITGTFSLSLPLMICTAATAAFAALFIIQMARRDAVRNAFEKGIGEMVNSSEPIKGGVRLALHQGGRSENESIIQYEEANQGMIDYIINNFGKAVTFTTRDGVNLSGYWHRSLVQDAPTAILFHGNACNAEDEVDSWGSFYKERGFNVLLVEYRGYGLSDGEAASLNQELEAYLDAEAAYKFVLTQKVSTPKILAHGYSLGGAYAAALGYFFNLPYVILDHTFTSYRAVFSHVSHLTPTLANRIIHAAYNKGTKEKDPDLPEAKDLQTDGFDNVSKVQKMSGSLFVIQGKEDKLMHKKFGEELIQARYPDNPAAQNDRLLCIDGGHNDGNNFFSDSAAINQFDSFLLEHALLT